MPYSFQIDRKARRLTIVGSDPVVLSDVLALLDRQIAEGAWSFVTFHDARLVTWLPTPDDFGVIVAYVDNNSRTLGPRGSVAFVADGAAVTEVAKMYSQIGSGSALHAEVFGDADLATRWLDDQAST